MNRIILYEDEGGQEFVILCTSQGYYDEIFGQGGIIAKDAFDIEHDVSLWPTNRPLTDDF